jgi:hypothetical protein
MDRTVPVLVTVLFAIVTFIFLLLGLLNGLGAIFAHIDAGRMKAASECGPQNSDSNCFSYRSASIVDSSPDSLLLDLGSGDTVPVDVVGGTRLAASVSSGVDARVKMWNGKVVEVAYNGEIVETTGNPNLYLQTWPVQLAFGALGVVITGAVYVILSSMTGYTPEFLRRRRSARRS